MDMEKLLYTKRHVAGLFDARQRQVIRVALARRRATLERMAGNLVKEGVASPDLVEQLVVIRGAEHEEEERTFPDHADMGVLAAFKEITVEELKFEAQRHQGTLFDVDDSAVSSETTDDPDQAAEAEGVPDDEADADGEWVRWKCNVCGTTRNYPRRDLPDNSAVLCPKDCGPTMRPVAAEDAPEPDAAPDAPETPEGELGPDDLVEADYEIVDEDPIRAQRLQERPEFRGRRAINALQEANIYTVGELLDRAASPISIGRIKGMGKTGKAQVEAVLDGIERDLVGRANGTAPVAADQEAAGVAPENDDDLPF